MFLFETEISVFDCNIEIFSFLSLSFNYIDCVSYHVMISVDFKLELSVLITVHYKDFYRSVDITMMGAHFVYADNLSQLDSKLIQNYSQFKFYFFLLMMLNNLSF